MFNRQTLLILVAAIAAGLGLWAAQVVTSPGFAPAWRLTGTLVLFLPMLVLAANPPGSSVCVASASTGPTAQPTARSHPMSNKTSNSLGFALGAALVSSLALSPLALLYVVVGWNSSHAVFGPVQTVRSVADFPDLAWLFLSILFAMAGVYVIDAFSFIYGAQVIGWTESTRNLMFIVVQITALIGALLCGALQSRLGGRRTYALTLQLWTQMMGQFFLHLRNYRDASQDGQGAAPWPHPARSQYAELGWPRSTQDHQG